MEYIDLRSDTVTQPTQAMRDAMYTAPVGDDVFQDDPTINELEALAAETFGKEAALFVPSGTQGNAICVMTHTHRGDSIAVTRDCHIFGHEAGSYAMLSGVSLCIIPDGSDGMPDPEALRRSIIDDSELQMARTGAVCVENARSDGTVVTVENLRQLYKVAHERQVPVHLDGARLFNAAVALGVDVRDMTQYCDSVLCCLSKGLCAPVGSVIAGSQEFIRKARKNRKILGGGMRQAGFLAAAGKLALTEMPKRLYIDHENAQFLAEGLEQIPGIQVAMERVVIDMVFFSADWDEAKSSAFPAAMLEKGIKTGGIENGEFRMVTNKDVSRENCVSVLEAVRRFSLGQV